MRHGYDPKLVFSRSGNLVAISTGSDACTEHECGSQELQMVLSSAYDSDAEIIAKLKAGREVSYPSLLQRKTLTKNLDQVQFIEVPGRGDNPPQALLGCAAHNLATYEGELRFPMEGSTYSDVNLAGAWDKSSFALRVRGGKYCKALKTFHEALKAGKVAFAGTFYKPAGERLGGVILADLRYIDDDSRKAMAEAQTKYESGLRLKARDDSTALLREMAKLSGRDILAPGHLWAVWGDAEESHVCYALNPSYEMSRGRNEDDRLAQYYGPYTREQLLAWASARYSHKLRPLEQTPA